VRYNFTDDGLERIAWAGLLPADVMRVLNAKPQYVTDYDNPPRRVVQALARDIYVMVGLEEAADDEWLVVGARRMTKDEIAHFERVTGGRP
jgi:hypothetical protein